jgi:hypothetical protein
MTIDRRLLAGALGLALAVAACGGSSPTGSSATAAPVATGAAATAAAQPTDAPEATEATGTEEPAVSEEPTASGAEPSLVPGAAADLEAMLPSEAAGVKYQKSSFDGASLGMLGGSIDTTELDPILKASGKTINDVRVAIAAPVDSASTEAGMVIAFQIRGVDAAKFMAAMGADTASMTKTTIGGKDVYQSGAGGFGVIVYPKNDVVFEVLMASDKVGESIVSQLP